MVCRHVRVGERIRAARVGLLGALVLASACGEPRSPAAPAAERGAAEHGAAALATAKVFDEHGAASACGPPEAQCPPTAVSNPFLDHCRMAGFVVRQCGCEMRCAGDISAATRHYDADGHLKECAPARADCTPPQAGSAFQDACTEHGFRLDVCGCEWLCAGDFKH